MFLMWRSCHAFISHVQNSIIHGWEKALAVFFFPWTEKAMNLLFLAVTSVKFSHRNAWMFTGFSSNSVPCVLWHTMPLTTPPLVIFFLLFYFFMVCLSQARPFINLQTGNKCRPPSNRVGQAKTRKIKTGLNSTALVITFSGLLVCEIW